jgi:hypothetical protein
MNLCRKKSSMKGRKEAIKESTEIALAFETESKGALSILNNTLKSSPPFEQESV